MKITGPYTYKTRSGVVKQRKKPYRLYHHGQQTWHLTKEAAERSAGTAPGKRKRMTAHNVDEYWHAREILKGVPLLRAARFYTEMHSAQTENSRASVLELVTRFKATLKGRPKYLNEAKRNLDLLADELGKMNVVAVRAQEMEVYLSQFTSEWSYDAALKFARSFFKWCISPNVHARRDNPTAGFEFKNPSGSRVYLTIEDTEHVLKTAKAYFPEILSAVALQLFAGIRTEEIAKLDWRYVRRGKIRLEPEVAKMGQVKGKSEPRFIDWWPIALDVWLPAKLPQSGSVAPLHDVEVKRKIVKRSQYLRLKGLLLERCRETKGDFRWGQNAMRHSYGTYGLAFFQSSDRIAKLMGERDVDTVHNHYASYESMENGQLFFSVGSDRLEAMPMPANAMELIQSMVNQAAPQLRQPASGQQEPRAAS